MTTFTAYLRQNLRVYITLICFVYVPCVAFGIEHIATIGQPFPKQHAFLTNKTFLRVVSTHIQIVDVNSGDVIDKFGNLTDRSVIVFSADASHVAILNFSGSTGKTNVEIWNVNLKEKISNWETELPIYDNAAFSPTAPLLVSFSKNQIHLWNWQTGESLGMMLGERRPTEPCYKFEDGMICGGRSQGESVFTSDGKHLIVGSNRPDIELWDVDSRELVGHFQGHIGDWVEGVVISPDGMRLASFEKSNFVYMWDMKSRQLLWKEKSGIARISEIEFSPDSQYLYVATQTYGLSKTGAEPWQGWDDKVRIWDVHSGHPIDTIGTKFRDLYGIALSSDGKTLLMHYSGGEVLWDIENNRQQNAWTDFLRYWYLNDVELSSDGKTVISVSSHFIKSWDVATEQMGLLIPAEDYRFEKVTISPDSRKFAIGKDPWVQIRDIQTGEVETEFPHYVSGVRQITYSHTGRWIAAVDDYGRVFVLDVENPEKIQRIDGRGIQLGRHRFGQIAFSENDIYLAASSRIEINNEDKHWIVLWKREVDTFIFRYLLPAPALYSPPAFTTRADGSTLLAFPGGNEEIQIWKLLLERPQLLTTLNEYTWNSIQFSQDGHYLYVNNEENNMQIWNWQGNRTIKHSSLPYLTSLSENSNILLSYNISGQYEIWDVKNVLSLLPYPVEPRGKQIVTLGQIKRDQLLQNFPNPFNPETWIPFRLANKSSVTIHIYTSTGELVRSLSPGIMSAGDYSSQSKAINWDGRNEKGESVSSGVYLYTINAGDFSATRKMLIRK